MDEYPPLKALTKTEYHEKRDFVAALLAVSPIHVSKLYQIDDIIARYQEMRIDIINFPDVTHKIKDIHGDVHDSIEKYLKGVAPYDGSGSITSPYDWTITSIPHPTKSNWVRITQIDMS